MEYKELIELSAKAVGVDLEYRRGSDAYYYDDSNTGREEWLPTYDYRQAMILMIELDMQVTVNRVDGFVEVIAGYHGEHRIREMLHPDMYDQTCLCITRAAAEIGKAM